jgi:hypothetical protein
MVKTTTPDHNGVKIYAALAGHLTRQRLLHMTGRRLNSMLVHDDSARRLLQFGPSLDYVALQIS